MTKSKRNEQLAQRLASVLTKLNNGERIDIHALAEEFGVSLRTVQRDIQRFSFLHWSEQGPRYYAINQRQFGTFNRADIERFSRFASISDLFPAGDRTFFQEKLSQSVQVKGFEYENIHHKRQEFELLRKAIEKRQYVNFTYQKMGYSEQKSYTLAPYSLLNKNGIWYLIGMDGSQKKTFSFSQIKSPFILEQTFELNHQFLAEIENSDSIYHGNQLKEIIVKVNKNSAPYFLRRNLLPNQTILHHLDEGDLLLKCENVNEREIMPLVQYWIPDVTIVTPEELQTKLIAKLNDYLARF